MKDITPEEKAKELIDIMLYEYEVLDNLKPRIKFMIAKRCAIIVANEMLTLAVWDTSTIFEWWVQIREEIINYKYESN